MVRYSRISLGRDASGRVESETLATAMRVWR
jgi:hypothetical protein